MDIEIRVALNIIKKF